MWSFACGPGCPGRSCSPRSPTRRSTGPCSTGAHAGMEAPFLILGFPEQADPDVVYVEYSTSGVYLEQPEDVHRYSLIFDHLRAAALRPDDTVELIDRTAD